jgi:mono/diheme cytochrome c family protein
LSNRPGQSGRRRIFLLFFLLILLSACSSSPSPDATGPDLYSQLCATCHGAKLEGKVGPTLGPNAPSALLPDDYLATSIRRGIGTMPSFDHLSEAQVSRLVSYIREIQRSG